MPLFIATMPLFIATMFFCVLAIGIPLWVALDEKMDE